MKLFDLINNDTLSVEAGQFFNRITNNYWILKIISKNFKVQKSIDTIWHYGLSKYAQSFPRNSEGIQKKKEYQKEKIFDYIVNNFKLPNNQKENTLEIKIHNKDVVDMKVKDLYDLQNSVNNQIAYNRINYWKPLYIIYFARKDYQYNGANAKESDLQKFIKDNFQAGFYFKDGKLKTKLL